MAETMSVQRMNRLVTKVRANPRYNFADDAEDHIRTALTFARARRMRDVETQAKILHLINSIDEQHTSGPNIVPIMDTLRGRVEASKRRYGMAIIYQRRAATAWRHLETEELDKRWLWRNRWWLIRAHAGNVVNKIALRVLPVTVEDVMSNLVSR